MDISNLMKVFKEYLYIVIGTILMSISTANFLLPNQLSTGGFSGIATVVYYLWKYPAGTVLVILNVPLLLIAFFRIDKNLFFKSIIGTALLSFGINIFERFGSVTSDRFLACVYGGIIMGIGTSIILRAGGSTGGTDLLSYVIRSFNKKYRSSRLILMADTIIIGLNIIFFREIEIGLYSAIAIYLMGKMIDIVFEGFYFTKIMFIISDKHEEIASVIGKKVKRGSTGLYSKGMYSRRG
ncbi:MAG: YitT family protein [Clostridia bacterium]|nr:YitT family protein [Clostridia bacterium]